MEQEHQGNGKPPVNSYAELRRLLVGPEQEEIDLLRRRLEELRVDAGIVSELLPLAVKLRLQRDGALRAALQPVVEEAIFVSVQKHPLVLAAALFPIIGAAVRKAVASALRAVTQTLNQIVEQSLSWRSLRWRWEAIRTGKPFAEILLARSLLYRVEQVFLIHRETGLLLRQEAAEAVVIRDAELVSGMLTAIQDFVQDSFGALKSEELETLRVGEYDVWIQHAPLAILAVVIRGSPPGNIRHFFEAQLEKICGARTHELERFAGDNAVFRSCQTDLRACLLGRAAPETRGLGWFWRLAGIAVLLAVGWGVFSVVRENVRWNRYLTRLRAEPGIVVADDQRNWFSHEVGGLRDPMAADPAALLEGSGIDLHKVTFHWEPYRSLDERFELLRRLAAEREYVESETFHFAQDKVDLPLEELGVIRQLAEHLQALFHLASRRGQTVSVEITGHTDDTGRPERNVELSAGRAKSVLAALEAQQIPPDRLRAKYSETAKGGSDAERPLDRYASLRVTLAPR